MEEVYDLLVAGGATSAEARCLSKPLAQGAIDIIGAVDDVPRTAGAVHERASGCASRQRVQEILEGVDRDDAQKLLETSESRRTQVAEVYRSLGATEEEVVCIIAIQGGPPGSLGAARWLDVIAVHEEPEYRARLAATLDAEEEELLRCASEDRLRELGAVLPDIDEQELERRLWELGAQLDASYSDSATGPR